MFDDDPLIRWARQDGRPGVRVFSGPDAVAVACPDLSRRDRLAVQGSADGVAALLADVLPQVGPTYRPLGDEALISAVAERVDGLAQVGRFGWMETRKPTFAGTGHWLTDLKEVSDLLETAFPDSYARPGGTGVRRWAGLRDGERLLATAAEAWPVREIGFLAGVATHPDARGRGLAGRLCAFVTDELLRDNERVALFVDYWNEAALRTYARLGFTLRPLGAAAQTR
jgi:ribosomal protein S18 acetylase RimI-like enzyme